MPVRVSCPACGGLDSSRCFMVNKYSIKNCATCDTLFVENLPSPEDLAVIYTTDGYYGLPPDAMQRIVDENQRRLKIIRHLKPNGKLLDIGCAHGLLLDQAAQEGYETFGVEPSSKNAEEATRKGHVVFNGWLDEFAAQNVDKRFDIITCLDVIEHISNPKEFLSLAASLLARDGIMVVSTPNYSGVVAKLLGVRDPYMTPPEHITFLTTAGMSCLASGCGLIVRQFQTFGRLIPDEMDRSVQRYFPRQLHFLGPALRPAIRFSFWVLNLMKLGLEQEVYLTRISRP